MYSRLVLYWLLIISVTTLIVMGLSGCMLSDPSQWRPEQHVLMSRNCRVVCRPGLVREYTAMDGSCICQPVTRSSR